MATEPEETQTVEGKADWSLRVGRPPLDITMFRKEKGGDPEIVRESQRRRNPVEDDPDGEQKKAQDAAVKLVDDVIALDEQWVRCPRPRSPSAPLPLGSAADLRSARRSARRSSPRSS